MASLNERAKVEYIIAEGLLNFHLYKDQNDLHEKVMAALHEVGLLPEFASRFPHEFSGGQRQPHRHRPRPHHGAGVHRGGRAHFGAGCFHPCPGAQPAEQPQGVPRADLPVHRPRFVGGPLHLGPHRRHQQGPYRGAGRDGRALPPSPAPLHQSPLSAVPIPDPAWKRRSACWSTIRPSTTTARTSPCGRKLPTGTSSTATRRSWEGYRKEYEAQRP